MRSFLSARLAASRAVTVALVVLAALAGGLLAQSAAPSAQSAKLAVQQPVPPAQKPAETRAAEAPAVPRAIALEDILAWKTIGPAVISNDGRWLAYRMSPVQATAR